MAARDPKLANLDTYTLSTPEPTDRPIGQIVGTTTIVGNEAVVLIDGKELQAYDGSVVDEEQFFAKDYKIENWQYYLEKSLSEINISQGCVALGDFSFARSGLKSIIIPEGVTEIGYAAFYHCDKLEEIHIPRSVKSIDAMAFDFTPWLENFHNGTNPYGKEFLVVGDGCLVAYEGYSTVVVIPYGVKFIGSRVFENHKEIVDVKYPDTIEYIEDDAFKGCNYKPVY